MLNALIADEAFAAEEAYKLSKCWKCLDSIGIVHRLNRRFRCCPVPRSNNCTLITKLELERNPLLRKLECGYNALFTLELDHHPMQEKLDCGNNHLIQLRVRNGENLLELRCNGNHLTELDISGCPRLESLRCFQNHLSKLHLNHSELIEVYCSENKMEELDTSKAPKLERLDCANHLIREPDYTVEGVGTFTYDVSMLDYKTILPLHGTDTT